MRTLVLGDIHGCVTALNSLVDGIPIDSEDLVIALGDYVDRGPDSPAVLDWMCERHASGKLVALRGNHELMMQLSREDPIWLNAWINCGGAETMMAYEESPYASGGAGLAAVPEHHWVFLEERLVDTHETEEHVYVHGGLLPELPLAEQPEDVLFWESFDPEATHCSGKQTICGHTAQRTGVPFVSDAVICLDTWVYGDGWLTCYEPATGVFWQANEAGEFRSFTKETIPAPALE